MFNKIIFTGDIFRPTSSILGLKSSQTANINWFYNILSWQLEHSTGLRVEKLQWDKTNGFDAEKFYRLNNLEPSIESWVSLFKQEELTGEAKNYLYDFLKNALVIGFELPDFFVKILDDLNIVYVDLAIHPIRYLDDIFFGIRTNKQEIFNEIIKYHLSEENFYLYAGLHKATVSKMHKKMLNPNSALFAGQTNLDKSIICKGKVLKLTDFEEKFENLSQNHETVYYKAHPLALNNKETKKIFKKFKNIKPIKENIYSLISRDEIEKVCSISSSIIYEAKYFGKDAEYFYKNPFVFADKNSNFDKLSYIPVYDEYFNPTFWAEILKSLVETKACENINFPKKTNRLRASSHSFWGYNFLEYQPYLQSFLSKNWLYKKIKYFRYK